MKSTMMTSPLLVPDMTERAARLFSTAEVVSVQPDGTRDRSNLGDLHRRSRQLAGALQAAGLVEGERVATLMWNEREHLEAYFGIPAAGGVLHALNMRLHTQDLSHVVAHAEDRFLIVEDVLLPIYEQLRPFVQFERIFVVNRTGEKLPEGTECYELFLAGAGGRFTPPVLDENDPAAICYTSGTTGKPKGVVYSHRSICLHALCLSLPDQLSISRSETVCPISSMFHVNAWGLPFAATMAGSRIVLPGRNLQPEALLDLMAAEQVTFSAAVPTVWMAILNALESTPGRWKLSPKLRIAMGGAAAAESLLRRFDKLGVHVIHAWGMTETGPLATAATLKPEMDAWPEDDRYAQRSRQGMALPFIDLRAVNDEGECPWDGATTGELEIRGPWVAAGYHGIEQSAQWTADGWLRTGDVVSIDPEGYIRITDRLKDLIKSGGEWISSVDLENTLIGHPAIREAAVIAVPHPKWQERPLAVIVLREGATVDAEELRAFLQQSFARWQVPDAFVFADELPHTSTGKLLKTKLRNDFCGWQWE